MANQLYGLGREGFLNGSISWGSDTIKTDLVDSADYILAIDTDQYYSSVTAAGRVASSGAMTTKTVTLGVADAADITFSAVTGDISEYLIGWKDTTVEATSPLIYCIDTATGLPVTPNGGDITVTWDAGANKIFKL